MAASSQNTSKIVLTGIFALLISCLSEIQYHLPLIHYKFLKKQADSAGRGSSVGCASAWYADGRGFDPHVRQHSFVEIGYEIISTAIFSLSLIQEEQLSGTGERMCTKYW